MKKILLFILLLTVAGCGFRPSGSYIKSGEVVIDAITVEVFKNNTRRPGVERVFSDAFAREFSNLAEIVKPGSPEAKAAMVGTIMAYEVDPTAVDENNIATSYRVQVTFNIKIETLHDNKVIWDETYADYEDFEVDRSGSSSRILITKDREEAMVHRIAEDRARIFRELVAEDFR